MFTDVIKFGVAGYYPGLTGWVQGSHKGPYKEKRASWAQGGDGAMGFEDEGGSHEPRNAGSGPPEAEQDRTWILPGASRRNTAPPTHFLLRTSGTVREYICVALNHQVVVTCFSSR